MARICSDAAGRNVWRASILFMGVFMRRSDAFGGAAARGVDDIASDAVKAARAVTTDGGETFPSAEQRNKD